MMSSIQLMLLSKNSAMRSWTNWHCEIDYGLEIIRYPGVDAVRIQFEIERLDLIRITGNDAYVDPVEIPGV